MFGVSHLLRQETLRLKQGSVLKMDSLQNPSSKTFLPEQRWKKLAKTYSKQLNLISLSNSFAEKEHDFWHQSSNVLIACIVKDLFSLLHILEKYDYVG